MEHDIRKNMKAHGRTLIEFLLREHILRDHGPELDQDNFEGLAPFKCSQEIVRTFS